MFNRFFQLVSTCALLSMLLVACGDDEPSSTADTGGDVVDAVDDAVADSVDTAGEPDATEEEEVGGPCTDEQCEALGQACNYVTHECVDNDRCLEEGDPCDPAVVHPLSFLCADDGSGDDVCIGTCMSHEECIEEEYCGYTEASEVRFICQEGQCDGVFDATSCGEGSTCVPVVSIVEGMEELSYAELAELLTGVYACVEISDTPAAQDEACAAGGDCGEGLLCSRPGGGYCFELGCAPDSGSHTCAAGSVCFTNDLGMAVDAGTCVATDCSPLSDPTGCAASEMCSPLYYPGEWTVTGTLPGRCVASGGGARGTECDANEDCDDGLICVGDSCQPLCDYDSATSGLAACGTNELCGELTYEDGTTLPFGFCVPYDCELFGDLACLEGNGCQPLAHVRNSEGAIVGLCAESTGSSARGESCTVGSDCLDGLVCVGEDCQMPCDRDYATTAEGGCESDETCAPLFDLEIDEEAVFGFCLEYDCEVFVGTSACSSGQVCAPLFVRNEDGDIIGDCLTAGTGDPGDSCDEHADCASGLCLDAGDADFCGVFCDVLAESGPGACGAGQRCVPFVQESGETMDMGYCMEVCSPFASDTGCASDEICLPDFQDSSFGYCMETGDGQIGDTCSESNLCGPGLLCVGTTCAAICDRTASTGETGACAGGDVCTSLWVANEEISFGSCSPGCIVNDSEHGCPEDTVCIWGPFGGVTSGRDYCYPGLISPNCNAGSEGYICGGLSACLDLEEATDGLECTELCRETVSPFLRVGHPDCSDTNAICVPVSANYPELGFCNSAQ